jgi:hypothetical protein
MPTEHDAGNSLTTFSVHAFECLGRVIETQRRPTFVLNYVTPHVYDLIDREGDRYGVRLPRKRRDGIRPKIRPRRRRENCLPQLCDHTLHLEQL